MSTFVTLGNATQPFDRLLSAVAQAYELLPKPVAVQHGSTHYAGPGDRVAAFLPMDEFAHLIQGSDLVIAHGGAGTILQALSAGKTPIVMPRLARHAEIIDDHQLEFTSAMASAARIVVVNDAAGLVAAIQEKRFAAPAGSTARGELVGEIAALLSSCDKR